MNRCLFLVLIAGVCVSSTPAAQFRFPTQTFTLPDGFEIEQVGGPPLVERPISASFDELGRLYVTDSSGSNDKPEKQLAEKPHRVRRLDGVDEHGRFTKSSLFADRMMFPEGCLWFDGSLYVSAPPSIWKLTDSNDDGLAEERSEWHEGKTLTGCANDLHGPYLGLDGWIYWCKGAFARQMYERVGRPPIVTRASHIFRSPPTHVDLEPVLTAGMDNPVGVVFTLSGERFMCGTFLMHPEGGKRDGIVHAVYGGVYGKSNDVLDDHPKTGDLMPIMTHLGAAAPCSVIRYESDVFGADFQDSLFVCCFNLHKVTRHVLQAEGATFKTVDTDFLVSDNTDFHPTDVIEDGDGSLLVIDTGGWYKLCCPTSQLSKPDVLGAIYRIRKKGALRLDDPRGLALEWEKFSPLRLVELLQDARPAVRKRALLLLSKTGTDATPRLALAVNTAQSPETRAEAVWALTRIDNLDARQAVRGALADRSEVVRQAAAHSVALWRDREAEADLLTMLQSSQMQLRRVAAEALGRIGSRAAIRPLLDCAARAGDRMLEHSAIFAVIEIGDPATAAQLAKEGSPQVSRAALIALDQMPRGGLEVQTVLPLLSGADAKLKQTALWIAGHHPEWGGEMAGFFQERLGAKELTTKEAEELKEELTQFVEAKTVQELIATLLRQEPTSSQSRRVMLEVMENASFKTAPSGWTRAVSSCLHSKDEAVVRAAVQAAARFPEDERKKSELSEPLLQLANDKSAKTDIRLSALAALPASALAVDSDTLVLLCGSLESSEPVFTRGNAADVVARAKLSDEQLGTLTAKLRGIGPLELSRVLQAFERSNTEAVGRNLVIALKDCRALASVQPQALQKLIEHYPEPVQQQGKALLKSLEVDRAQEAAHLDELLGSLANGDIRRGQSLFNSQKAACSSCHAMGYLGGHVGPDLTSIGQVRTERDLLESIVYPSASFVRSFEPYIVKTKSEEDYNGVLKKDAPEEIVLATGPTTEVRIARSDIVEMRPSTVSVMPAGMEQQLTKQELADLVAFLKATKWGAQ